VGASPRAASVHRCHAGAGVDRAWERAGMQRQDPRWLAIARGDDTTSCPTSATTFEPSTPPRPHAHPQRAPLCPALPCPALLAGLLQPIAATTPRLLAASAPGESSHGTSTPLVTSPSPASGLRRLSDRRHWAPACPLCPPLQADHLHEILRSLRYRRTRSSPTPTARKPHHRGPA
jgi:hypothetical protein